MPDWLLAVLITIIAVFVIIGVCVLAFILYAVFRVGALSEFKVSLEDSSDEQEKE
jgi:hypothetical protein